MAKHRAIGPERPLPEIQTVPAPVFLYRVATPSTGLEFARIDALTAASDRGNRFDVPGGGVLYCGSDIRGCFAETLSRYRIKLNSPAAAAAALDTGFMPPGSIPADWRAQRLVFKLYLENALPFVDIENEETRARMSIELAGRLAKHGIEDLDVAAVRGGNRRLTRDLAQWAYTAVGEDERPNYSGIRYMSKHGEYECWAVFEGTGVQKESVRTIEWSDEDLQHVGRIFNLTVH